MGINAPYNFAPIADQVVFPEWGNQVSHDIPFSDGLCGEIAFTVTAKSELLVGGEQTPGTKQRPGEVHFFQTPGEKTSYAIPGSSLRGMLRNVAEIATFSRMNAIDNKRYGLRDITGPAVSASYAERVRNRVKFGFLQLDQTGKPTLTPCKMARLDHRSLENQWSVAENNKPIFSKRKHKKVSAKYAEWQKLCQRNQISDPLQISFEIVEGKTEAQAVNIGKGKLSGFPVFTGQISDYKDDKPGRKNKAKHKDFVFYDSNEQARFALDSKDPNAWCDFLFIHGDEDGKPEMSWPDYWRDQFWAGQPMPVFYIETGSRISLGLAFMPKLAGDFSTHDLLEHSSEDHVSNNQLDFATILFGQVGDKPEQALKGRISVEPAILNNDAEPVSNPEATILNGAKPSYFPNYLYQALDQSGERLKGKQYATYVYSAKNNPAPELRGWKRYPVRPNNEIEIQKLVGKQNDNNKVKTKLHALKPGAIFKGRVVFHNLRPPELGALLWSMQFEGNRHSLGMGKSFGYGQVEITLDDEDNNLRCNMKGLEPKTSDAYIATFEQYMSETLETPWRETPSVKALVAMSKLECRSQFSGDLKHMEMGKNEFVEVKQTRSGGPYALASYVEDKRQLKRRSHIDIGIEVTSEGSQAQPRYDRPPIEQKDEAWEAAVIYYNPGGYKLTATVPEKQTASCEPDLAKILFESLSNKKKKDAKKGTLRRSVTISIKGNNAVITGWHGE